MISNSFDIGFIYDDIYGTSCEKLILWNAA